MSETLVRDSQEISHNDPTTGEPLPPVDSPEYWNSIDNGQNDLPDEEKGIEERSESEVLDEFIAERAKEAMNDCEFQSTPELQESIEGFYHDHFYLAGAIKAIAEGRFDSELFEAILRDPRIKDWERGLGESAPVSEIPNAITAAYRLARISQKIVGDQGQLSEEQMRERHVNALRHCGDALRITLFRETSVGISTIGDSEVVLAQELATQVRSAASEAGFDESSKGWHRLPDPDNFPYLIGKSQEAFWDDTRHAGQLLFHGTSDLGEIHNRGAMSRNQQVRETGRMNAQTTVSDDGGRTMHSVVPHFSEFYGGHQYAAGERGGTFAIPLVKIIEQAPYARDAKYGLLIPKTNGVLDRVPSATRQSVGSSAAGEADEVGSRGPDRVFFASPDEESDTLPDDYVIKMNDKKGKPATYVVNDNYTRSKMDVNNLGVGYGFAESLVIEEGQESEAPIRALQEEYQRQYASRGIVVPLRRGIFAQIFENHPVESEGRRRTASIYNRYTPGSEAA